MVTVVSAQHTILVLDDEELIRETLADYLTDMGHCVFTYADGEAALEALRTHSFSIAIVDIRLPGIGGLTFVERASHIRPQLRYIIHTGSLEFSNGAPVLAANERIEAVLVKPVPRLRDFSDIIDRLDPVK